ncbi:MAG: RNA-directed DNA polymerase [Methylococcales bacterium]|nr:RNA-directed DNA polymerase [Methylococcales bacterium]
MDFRSLNKIIRPISFPLPLIDDILTLLCGAKVFTSLDCKSGYYQVPSEENDKEKTVFPCHRGLFQFNVIPFGLSTTPSIFQELANIVLQGCEELLTAYLDDILILPKNEDEHLKHIQEVFDRLRQHGLKLKLKKCSFFKRETEYLGFIINQNVVKPNPDKVKAIRNLPSPKTVRQIRGFMGMIGFYRRFIPNFSQIAEPFIALTKKYTFVLNSSGQLTVKKHLIFLKKVFQWFPFCHIPIQTNPMFYTRMLAIHVLVQFSHKWLMTKKNVLNYTGSETKSRYSSFLKN